MPLLVVKRHGATAGSRVRKFIRATATSGA